MSQNVSNTCLHCEKNITGRQLALGCSVCCRWQHRKCNMGIDIVVYRVMVQGTIPWKCLNCRPAPKKQEDMNQKELFLKYFSLGKSVSDETVKGDFVHGNDDLNGQGDLTDSLMESMSLIASTSDSLVEDITSDIPWLPKIETVYSEALAHEEENIKHRNNKIDEPSISVPWFPKIVAVYSEAVNANESSDLSSLLDYEPILDMSWIPKIDSVYSGVSSDDISSQVMVSDPVYKTFSPIENCPTCNIGLVPMQFTVNVVTAVMKTTCQCGLSIEINIRSPHSKVAVVQKKRKRCETNTTLKRLRLTL